MTTPTSTKVKVSLLELVYPPMSNQEAVWMQSDPDVVAMLRESDFYMIAGRAEARFTDFVQAENGTITFNFRVGESFCDSVEIRVGDLPNIRAATWDTLEIELGDKLVRIWDGPPHQTGSTVLDWFTTEKLLWERGREREGIAAFARFREAACYDLLYVGIAKVGDSFDRLIKHGHKARMEILANEPQRFPGARVTDETYLFLFRVEPLIMTTYEFDHDFTGHELSGDYDAKRIVADAEKAFVSLLKPGYNIQKFANYPKGTDGLYGSDYLRYGYALAENFTFDTAHGQFKGGRHPMGFISNDGDAIFVEGDKVSLFVSGVDFPSDYGEIPAPPAETAPSSKSARLDGDHET